MTKFDFDAAIAFQQKNLNVALQVKDYTQSYYRSDMLTKLLRLAKDIERSED